LPDSVVAVGLTLVSYAVGWTPVTWPTCSGDAPFTCVQDWLATAGGALVLANLLYVAVYTRVFRSAQTNPA
jgi:hypothetical protein